MATRLDTVVELARIFIQPVVGTGSTVCDATSGNGHDTVFLASLVPKGKVYSFDVQTKALTTTRCLLEREGLVERVKLIHDGHENIGKYIQEPLQAVMFNLGYLPGGDHEIVSNRDTTLAALNTVLDLLARGGRISIVAYTGHQGGTEERDAVMELITNLKPNKYAVISTKVLNRNRPTPELFLVEKVGVGSEKEYKAKKNS